MPLCFSRALDDRFAADNWPEFRGPHGDGHADAKNLPLTWSDTENVRWKTAIHDKGWSSPVVWGNQDLGHDRDRERATSAMPSASTATRARSSTTSSCSRSGSLRAGRRKPRPALPHRTRNGGHSTATHRRRRRSRRAASTFILARTGTACLDTATGKVLWKRDDLKCNHHRGAGSSPILYGDMLYLTFDGFDVQYLVALNKMTGKTVWKQDRQFHPPTMNGDMRKAYSTPLVITVNGRPELVSPSAERRPPTTSKTGEEIWHVIHGGMNAALRPVFGHGTLFTDSADGGLKLVAIRPDGTGNITKTSIAWTYGKGAPNRSSFLLVDDYLLMVNSGGIASCVNANNGKEIKKIRLESQNGKFWGSPIVAEGKWYAFDDEGHSFVISADKKLDVLAANKLPAGTRSSPAAVGQIAVRAHIHALVLSGRQKVVQYRCHFPGLAR